MKKKSRFGLFAFAVVSISSMTLAGCGPSKSSSASTSEEPADPSWTADSKKYTFPTPASFTGADKLPTVDHAVAFCPSSLGWSNVYIWSATMKDGTVVDAAESLFGGWPGKAMTTQYDESWFQVDLGDIVKTNIIFNGTGQTADMTISGPGYWWYWTTDGKMHNQVPPKYWVDSANFLSEKSVKVIANVNIASFDFYEGETKLLTGTPGTQGVDIALNKHTPSAEYAYKVVCKLEGSSEEFPLAVNSIPIFDGDSFGAAYNYDGADLGLTYTAAKSSFKVWSPFSSKIVLRVYDNGTPVAIDSTKGNDAYVEHEMTKGEKGVWSVSVDGDLAGKYYTYVVTNKTYAAQEIVDPYAKAVGVDGKRGEILDLATTNPTGWDSVTVNPYDRKQLTVWECHIADLTSSSTWGGTAANAKKYAGFHETGTTYTTGSTTVSTGFDHVKELGVNAVQILPMFDQDNDEINPAFNWGYNPLNYNAPEGVYSSNPYDGATRIKELKALIADYTKAGINIIMDVVYNHVAGATKSNFDVLLPGYYFRYTKAGVLSNGSGCGNETASNHYMMRKFIVDSATYWAKEYKLGGFRFDLMGLHDLTTMNEVAASCKKVNPKICIYGEPWQGGTSTLSDSETAKQVNGNSYVGYGQFNDGMRDALIKGGLNSTTSQGWVTNMDMADEDALKVVKEGLAGTTDSATIIADPDKTTNYVACHDNYTIFDRVVLAVYGRLGSWTKPMCTLANSVVFTSQGTSFMLSGDEFCRTKGQNGNSYNASYKVNELDYALKVTNAASFAHYQKLINFKKSVDGMHLDKAGAAGLSITSNGSNEIVYEIKDTTNNKTYKIVHVNGYGTPAAVDFSGYSNVYLDTLDSGVALSASTAVKAFQTIIASK